MPAILPDAEAACLVDRIGTVRRDATAGKTGRIETFSRSRYAKAMIPGGLYRGNDSPTPTSGVRATLVATAATPDDVVYFVVKSEFENFEEFKGHHPALAHLDRREMARAARTTPLPSWC